MSELSSPDPYYVTVLLWLAKTGILALVSGFLAWLGVRAIDTLTPLHERQHIGESPVATGWFIAGFFILMGMAIHGGATAHPTRSPVAAQHLEIASTITVYSAMAGTSAAHNGAEQ